MAKRTGKMEYGTEDKIKGELSSKGETVLISMKIEGEFLDALKAHAAKQKRPYTTVMKEMLRARLEEEQQSAAGFSNAPVSGGVTREDVRHMIDTAIARQFSKRKASTKKRAG